MVNIQTQRYFVSFYSSARGTARGDTKLGASHDESMGFFLILVASGDVSFARNGQE